MTALVEFVITIGSLIGLSATVLYVWFKVICGNSAQILCVVSNTQRFFVFTLEQESTYG